MSLLLQQGGPPGGPASLEGREVLVGPDPAICRVKGVMFSARREFLIRLFGERTYYSVLSKLSPSALRNAMQPVADGWYEFATLVEYDRAIHGECHGRYPYILELLGAASAELGITRVFQKLDVEELYTFLENCARFHEQYQKFGWIEAERIQGGARMNYYDYDCYSPVFCASGIGFMLEAILRHGGRNARVEHPKCHCRNDSVCTYELTWQ